MSSLPATLGIVLSCALLGVVIVLLKHKFFPAKPDDESDTEPADYIAMMISVIYALVLGLALVAVYGTNSDAQSDVQTESGALYQVYMLADSLPAKQEAQVRSTADAYAHYVTTVEWKRMADHRSLGPEGWTMLDKLRDIYQSTEPARPTEQNAAQEALSQISTLDQARLSREQDGESTMSPVLWIGLFIGGVLTVGFMFAFGVKRQVGHLIMVMCLSGFIVFMILLIYQLDQPFSGILSVGSGAFGSYFGNA